jgi:NMD protein affecting ribosome stability and mRNA decay
MRTLPCPRCGSPETLGTFCKDCLRELHPLVQGVKEGKVVFCVLCDRIHQLGGWKRLPVETAVAKALEHSLAISWDAVVSSIRHDPQEFERKPGIKKTATVHVTVRGRHKDAREEYDEEYDIPLPYEVTTCPQCKHRTTTYYEGILQVRNESPRSHAIIEAYLTERSAKGTHLAKRIPMGTGTDYYLSSNRAVGHLARKLHAQLGGTLKVNAQHFSESKQEGKILYRTNALLELPDYGKGDIIVRDDRPYLVLGIAHSVKAENVRTGAEEHFPYKRGEARVLPIETARVCSLSPIAVLHPRTYQATVPVASKYAPCDADPGAEVSVAVDGDELYLVPSTAERPVRERKRRRVSQKRKDP